MPEELHAAWHTKTISDALKILQTRESGLTAAEAAERLVQYGQNKLPEGKTESLAAIFLRQFESPLIFILIAAGAAIFAIGEKIDSAVIFAVLIFNAVVGTIQEGRAQNTLGALKRLAETSAGVMREGKELIIPDTDIVPGDIIILREGEKVPADARIISANTLSINEASLTGESEPVSKIDTVIDTAPLPAADQKNMLFKGTYVLRGGGTAVVAATGTATEIGKIAGEIASIDTEIPLKKDVRALSELIIAAVALISVWLIFLGVFFGESLVHMITIAVALSVSIIPEGLPIVITLVLATGVWRMSKRNALVKRLQAVEALGQTRIIAVDKTGTLTLNEMALERVYAGGQVFEITGQGYEPKGDALLHGSLINPALHPELILAGKIALYSATARISYITGEDKWKIAGDPTEAAMLVFAEKMGFRRETLESEAPKVFEVPFDYRKKYRAVVRLVEGKNFLAVAGAPEAVLKRCDTIWRSGKPQALDAASRSELAKMLARFADEGFRVIAYAFLEDLGHDFNLDSMPPLVFGGYFAIKDALRADAAAAVWKVAAAGIKVVMITGDYAATARSVAKEAGIYKEGDTILTGEEIDACSDGELAAKLRNTTVFARVTPEHKLRIIQAYRARGEVVAMTGDGVNDAPSLVAADLGVAMGKIGTEVAKEAADIVLLDDNFSSIIDAVEEGRSIYKTIKKVILYLFSTSLGEVLAISGALLLGLPIPLLPAQIIWLNFVTDGFLDVALAMDPKEKGLLRGGGQKPRKYFVDKLMVKRMAFMAIPMAAGTLYLFSQYHNGGNAAKAWTVSLTLLAVFQWLNAWNCRSEDKSIFQLNPFANKFLVGATALVITLQIAALHLPVFQNVLRTVPLAPREWAAITAIALSIVAAEEIRKFFYRRREKKESLLP
ncbi:MAG: HAD-IC family P-type ATPase [Patescibacteria group bacterium]